MTGERTLPGLGLTGFWDPGSDGWDTGMDANLRTLSAVVQLSAISATTSLPAGSDGDVYIVPSGDANGNDVAVKDDGAWVYQTPVEGWRAWVQDTAQFLYWDGAAWSAEPDEGIADAPSDGTLYARKDAGWENIPATSNPRFLAGLSAAATISADTWTTVAFNTEAEDTASALASGVFTAPQAGTYLFGATLLYQQDTTTPAEMRVGISLNDATPTNYQQSKLPSAALVSNRTKVDVTVSLIMAQGDTARVKVYMETNSGKVAGTNTCFFWGFLILPDFLPVTTGIGINAQTGTSYTAVLADANGLVTMDNASANTFTLPLHASVAYATGTQIAVKQKGAGVTTIAAPSGGTINGVTDGSCDISGQWGTVVLTKLGMDAWSVDGPHDGVT